jgi:hypothetical protein
MTAVAGKPEMDMCAYMSQKNFADHNSLGEEIKTQVAESLFMVPIVKSSTNVKHV